MTDDDPTLDDVADALLGLDDPVAKAGEVADTVDCSRRHALDLLRLLERNGDVESKQIGGRAVAWWHTDRVLPARTPGEASEERRGTDPQRGESPDIDDSEPAPDLDDDRADAESQLAVTDAEIRQAVERAADHWDDAPDRHDARKQAAEAALRLIRDEGPLSRSDVIDALYADHSVDGQSERTWWRKNLAETTDAPLKQLGEYANGAGWRIDAEK